MKIKKWISVMVLTAIMVVSGVASVFVAYADNEENKEYYVAFSHQNYAIRNSNKMEQKDDGNYYLEKVSLSSAIKFYVTDQYGVHYYSVRGEKMEVDEAQTYRYNIKFSPDSVFDTEEGGYQATNGHITYSFYTPESVQIEIGDAMSELTYNPYFTSYDLYYLSSVKIAGGTTVRYQGETHSVSDDGTYRILFTPTVVRDGKEYAFDSDGRYGSGEEYVYNLYLEDAAEYYVVWNEGASVCSEPATAQINGKDAYLLNRYEKNLAEEEYRYHELFVAERDGTLKYQIYEREITGNYRLLDDDNDEDTNVSKLILSDAGWYELSFTVFSESYRTTAEWSERRFDDYYIVGEFNGYGFNGQGGVDLDEKFAFERVEDGDDDYNVDYDQYILYLTIAKADLADGDVEFYITDGKNKYKNGSDYITLNTVGKYKILFSDEHVYSRGRYYRYTLLDESQEGREIEISTVEEFFAFAENCSKSADYSRDLSVYLTCDLDFKGKPFVSVRSFGGTFFGGYHTLKNIELVGDSDCLAVFELVTRTGRIERLQAENLSVGGKDSRYVGFVGKNYGMLQKITVGGTIVGNSFVGGVTAYNGVSQIDDGSASLDSNNVVQSGVVADCVSEATVTGKSDAGGIAGFNSGEILSCENRGSVLPDTQTKSNLTNFGGIAGFSAGKLSDCLNRGAVGQHAYALYVGGVVGFGTGELYFCANYGEIAGRKYVGGVIGGYGDVAQSEGDRVDSFGGLSYAEIINKYFNTSETENDVLMGARHNLVYLQNYGAVKADSYAGGVLANSNYNGLTVLNALSVGDLICGSGGYLGGIVGNGSVSVIGCFSSGTFKASGTNANYVGGIVGNGKSVQDCMSVATIFGSDFVGGIAGNITDCIASSYTNVVLVCDDGSRNVGLIAGCAESFNESLNAFPDQFQYNYYIGDLGGIARTEYAHNFAYAACAIGSDQLLSEGSLSVYLHEFFDHDYWQGGGQNSYPVLTKFYECDEIEDVDDEETLFLKHAESMQAAMEESAQISYSVVFLEWNQDNGDLYDDGEIQVDNFEEIASFRVKKGESVREIALKFAEQRNGQWVYEGSDRVYFVTLRDAVDVQGNTVVYAEYTPAISTLATDDGAVLVEGLFDARTQISLEKTGNYYGIKFSLDGQEIEVTDYVVKFRKTDGKGDYTVYSVGEERTQLDSDLYGDYICFELESGLFEICEIARFSFTNLEIALISVSSVLGGVVIVLAIGSIVKRRKKAQNSREA